MHKPTSNKCIGVIGGLGVHAGNDIHAKMRRSLVQQGRQGEYEVLFAQQRFDGHDSMGADAPRLNGRKFYVFDMMRRFERRRAVGVMLPCFVSHTFLHELQAELRVPIINIMDALLAGLAQTVPGPRKVGVLTSDYARRHQLFEHYLHGRQHMLLYPSPQLQRDCVMGAVYGCGGLQADGASPRAIALLLRACADLMAQGADVIVPGITEIALVAEALRASGLDVIDTNQAYVDYAITAPPPTQRQRARSFKLGIVGGIGPAATVDFMAKIIRNTAAQRDQDHMRLVVEHNPKVPDRTANLVGHGADPTLALYAACQRLEADDADLIAIACNTAHAYVARIEPSLSVPIINMLQETVAHIGLHHGACRRVGLLATTGTVASQVYHEAARGAPFELLIPDSAHQALVMDAIYGERGVKAGYLEGQCERDLMRALVHLVERGASVVVLGCTELPLLLRHNACYPVAGTSIALLDPTEILARRCVALAQQHDDDADDAPTAIQYPGLPLP